MRAHIEPPPLPGDQVGSYRLGDMLGVGGMATVYKATHPEHGLVALKVLHPGKADTEEARRFRREFLTLRELDHPAVVRVFEAGKHGVYPWLAMEYVDGVDLGTLVDRWNAEPPADRFGRVEVIFRDLCEALRAVHVAGLVHRDLKPSNVLVTSGGRAKLTDFGVVKSQGGQFTTQLTVAGKLVGTVAFMAPEQITGEVVQLRWHTSSRDVGFSLAGDDTHYYINRGLDMGMDSAAWNERVLGQTVVLEVVDRPAGLNWFGSVGPIRGVLMDGDTLYRTGRVQNP